MRRKEDRGKRSKYKECEENGKGWKEKCEIKKGNERERRWWRDDRKRRRLRIKEREKRVEMRKRRKLKRS